MMEIDERYVEQLKNDIAQCNLRLKSIIQFKLLYALKDIYNNEGPLEKLNELNGEGRKELSALKNNIEELEVYGKEMQNEEMVGDAGRYKEQYYNNFSMFRKSNVAAMLAIEKAAKSDLFSEVNKDDRVRQRQKHDKANLAKMSSNITDQLLSISRRLADTTQLSADTLSSLATSSSTVHSTGTELTETRSAISQSGKLLSKYSRRQFTDKLILLLGFVFFFACVLYVLKRRIF